jgi:hypothetical protein
MKPISPVIKNYEDREIIFAKDQPEYLPLPALRLTGDSTPILSRWRFTEEERTRVALVADILLTQFIFTDLYHPIQMEVSE